MPSDSLKIWKRRVPDLNFPGLNIDNRDRLSLENPAFSKSDSLCRHWHRRLAIAITLAIVEISAALSDWPSMTSMTFWGESANEKDYAKFTSFELAERSFAA